MEGGRFQPDTMLSTLSDTPVDFDFMDELGCWLEITSDFLQPGNSNSTPFFNSQYLFPPASEITDGRPTSNPNPNPNLNLNPNPPQNDTQQESERSVIPKTPSSMETHPKISVETRFLHQSTIQIVETSGQSECHQADGNSELSRRWLIGPKADTSHVSSVKDRLIHALSYVQDFIRNGDALVQIWVPMKRDGKNVLITDDQPFTISPTCQGQGLASYRTVSMNYQFPADEDSKELVGLPGRVFLGKVPEWTPDVRFFSSDEYPRIDYAQQCDVRGTLAIPIFEHGSRSCLGVVELVMTTQKLNYRLELENVCKALEAVDLRGPELSSIPQVKATRVSYQAVLPEILEVLGAVCEAHRLPLAQTWVPCIQQGKEGCRHSYENYAYCVSTVDSACYVTDPQIWDFHGACSEHHLFKGQGIAGRAFITNQPCFSSDITTFSKKDYPLSHYAKMFGLRAAVAIRLRSIYTGKADYVLEFFLPVDCRDDEEQKKMLNSLSIIIQRVCRSLRVVTDKELEEGTVSRVNEVIAPSDRRPKREETKIVGPVTSKVSSQEESSWFAHMMEAQRKGKHVQKEEPGEGFKVTTHWNSSPEAVLPQGQTFTDLKQHHSDSGHKNNVESGADSSFGDRKYSSSSKAGEKRRTKMEKTISLQVLRQYFAGSLKDAAKNIGVCPTTLKRICRQHGITRWPSRKIKKVGHSLRKLQVVIDSVQGAEGAFQIGSIYANFPELTSPNLSGTSPFSTLKQNDQLKPLNTQPEGASSPQAAALSPQAAASNSTSSSCSQSSSSSLCFSGGKHQQSHITHLLGNEDASVADNRGAATLKRARSDAELHYSAQEEPKILTRSHSQKFPSEHPHNDENLPPLPKSGSRASRDKGSLRVKVSYGEEKVRFSLQLHWDFKDIQQEIAKRFHIDDMSKVDLKYLDDDAEWVLLTCDADLEECMDIYKSSQTHTIKLTVHQVPLPNLGSSFGSSTPS